MATKLDIAFATITQTPTVAAPVGSHAYTGTVQMPNGGVFSNVRIGQSVGNIWPDPLYVRPLPKGRIITGVVTNNQDIQWDYTEVADFGLCGGGSSLLSGGGSLASIVANASRDELRFLKKMLAEVDL